MLTAKEHWGLRILSSVPGWRGMHSNGYRPLCRVSSSLPFLSLSLLLSSHNQSLFLSAPVMSHLSLPLISSVSHNLDFLVCPSVSQAASVHLSPHLTLWILVSQVASFSSSRLPAGQQWGTDRIRDTVSLFSVLVSDTITVLDTQEEHLQEKSYSFLDDLGHSMLSLLVWKAHAQYMHNWHVGALWGWNMLSAVRIFRE